MYSNTYGKVLPFGRVWDVASATKKAKAILATKTLSTYWMILKGIVIFHPQFPKMPYPNTVLLYINITTFSFIATL